MKEIAIISHGMWFVASLRIVKVIANVKKKYFNIAFSKKTFLYISWKCSYSFVPQHWDFISFCMWNVLFVYIIKILLNYLHLLSFYFSNAIIFIQR